MGATAASLKISMTDKTKLNTALMTAGVTGVTVIAAPDPTIFVKVATEVRAYDGKGPIAAPTKSALSANLGVQVQVDNIAKQDAGTGTTITTAGKNFGIASTAAQAAARAASATLVALLTLMLA